MLATNIYLVLKINTMYDGRINPQGYMKHSLGSSHFHQHLKRNEHLLANFNKYHVLESNMQRNVSITILKTEVGGGG